MQITEEDRKNIALALPSLGLEEAKTIALKCGCSHDTVYREWRKIKGKTKGKIEDTNPVVQGLIDLAVLRKKETLKAEKRFQKSMQQLSAA